MAAMVSVDELLACLPLGQANLGRPRRMMTRLAGVMRRGSSLGSTTIGRRDACGLAYLASSRLDVLGWRDREARRAGGNCLAVPSIALARDYWGAHRGACARAWHESFKMFYTGDSNVACCLSSPTRQHSARRPCAN